MDLFITYKSNMNKQSDNDYKVVKSLVCGDKERLYNLYLLIQEGCQEYAIQRLLEKQNEIFENISRKEWR